MSEITNLTLHDLIKKMKSKEFSSVELTESYIKNIENAKKLNGKQNRPI